MARFLWSLGVKVIRSSPQCLCYEVKQNNFYACISLTVLKFKLVTCHIHKGNCISKCMKFADILNRWQKMKQYLPFFHKAKDISENVFKVRNLNQFLKHINKEKVIFGK